MTTLCEKNQLARFWQFLSQNGYAFGVFWAIMISLTSAVNDVFAKMLGERLHSLEVIFFRFLFSLISLIPFMMRQGGSEMFKTSFMKFHLIRGILGFAAMACWSLSLVYLPLAEVSTLFLTTPLFFLPLAFILLREHVTMQRWIATLLGFIGILIIVQPTSGSMNYMAFIPLGGSVMFALMDVLNKKMVATESTLTLLFYFALVTTVIGFGPMLAVWQTPTLKELVLLATVGIGANLIQVCIFKAFSATEASALAPFRYVELLFAASFGFVIFAEIPTKYTLLGGVFIIAATFYISYFEGKRKKA